MQNAIAAPTQNCSLLTPTFESNCLVQVYHSCSPMDHSAAKINLSWCMNDTATKSCISPASCFYLYSLNVITTETVKPQSNDSLLVWFLSTASSNCEPIGAVTSERKNKESVHLSICTHTHKTANKNPKSRNSTQ